MISSLNIINFQLAQAEFYNVIKNHIFDTKTFHSRKSIMKQNNSGMDARTEVNTLSQFFKIFVKCPHSIISPSGKMISINTSCGRKIPVDRKINNSLEIILQTVKNVAKFLLNFTENLYNEMKIYIFR